MSSDPTYYVRIKGRVSGPHALTRLTQLARAGQLSRLHEISENGQEWNAAGKHDALFPNGKHASSSNGIELIEEEHDEAATSSLSAARPTVQTGPTWWCSIGGKEFGPIPEAQIAELVANGKLNRKDLVWRTGLAEWKPAESVLPELWSQQLIATSRSFSDESEVSGVLLQVLSGTVLWTVILAVVRGAFAYFPLFGGLRMILHGETRNELLTGMALTTGGLLWAGSAVTSFQVARSIMRFSSGKRTQDELLMFVKAHRVFWIYDASMFICLLIFTGVMSVLAPKPSWF